MLEVFSRHFSRKSMPGRQTFNHAVCSPKIFTETKTISSKKTYFINDALSTNVLNSSIEKNNSTEVTFRRDAQVAQPTGVERYRCVMF